ncbi:MAG: carbohydrate ABC transporter permease [bacterium]|nr:carbohydrate ABC transporter permease [bacterium]
MDKRTKEIIKKSVAYLFLGFGAITMLLPFFWMVATSLKEPGEVFTISDSFLTQLIPDPVVWSNYPKAWTAVPFPRFYFNTILVTVLITFGQVFTSSLAAYAFARLTFPGRDKLFFGYLATMMVPGVVTMIPVFILLRTFGELWNTDLYLFGSYFGKPIGIDSYFALIVPGMFSAYGTFMLRQFFMSLPVELEEAAKIDGSSLFGIYCRITLPLSKPALATLTTFVFMGSWKDFMWPLIVTNSMEMKTLPVGLQSFQGLYTTEWTLLMAGSIIMLAPIIIVFIFNQRFFVEGIKLAGIKG